MSPHWAPALHPPRISFKECADAAPCWHLVHHRFAERSIITAFWKKRLLLAELDYGYFGRMLATRHDGRWRRRKTTDDDYAIGLKHFERVGKGSTQKTVDVYRKHLPLISRCLIARRRHPPTARKAPTHYYDKSNTIRH